MTPIRPWLIACGAGFGSMLGAAILGNILYGSASKFRWTPDRALLMVLVFGGLLVFVYSLVPLLLRGFLTAQVRIGNGDFSMVAWLIANERTARFVVWTIWTLGLAIALPVALRDWSLDTPSAEQPPQP